MAAENVNPVIRSASFYASHCKGSTPYVATDSKFLILELSNKVTFVSEFQLKQG